MQRPSLLLCALPVLFGSGLGPRTAQETEGTDLRPLRPTPSEMLFGPDDPRQELLELFQRVEKKLVDIDEKLAAAGAGEAGLEEVADSGLEDLLRDSRDKGEEVVADIDRILEIAEQLGGT